MKILWLCNTATSEILKHLGFKNQFTVTWIENTAKQLSSDSSHKLSFCFPSYETDKVIQGQLGNLHYICFPAEKNPYGFKNTAKIFCGLLKEQLYDIIHIWGSEYSHTLAMLTACKDMGFLNKSVLSVQGLIHFYSYHYSGGVPCTVKKSRTIKEFVKRNNIQDLQKNYFLRGKNEVAAIKTAANAIGRTNWDKTCLYLINPALKYYTCNETLRGLFYKSVWNVSACDKYTVFVAQSNMPYKGLHYLISAINTVKQFFPDVKLRVAGQNITDTSTALKKLKISSYGKYLNGLIKKYGLKDNVEFLGALSEEQMVKEYLRAYLFVSPSVIENSPNSVGEAMLLGVPCICSYAGGTPDIIKENEECLMYQADAPYMLAGKIIQLFKDENLAIKLSENARERALVQHDPDKNYLRLTEIYTQIAGQIK